MHLRHIRPRSVEWYDAITEEVERGLELSPEEKARLRTLHDLEHGLEPVSVEHAILGSISPQPMRRPDQPRTR